MADQAEQHADTVRPYRRPQWTGRPMVFSDGSPDYEFSQCPSCLAFHHERSKSCNGKREPWPIQCAASLGEVQCQRPGNHLGPHEAESESMRMEWEPKGTHIDGSGCGPVGSKAPADPHPTTDST